MLNNILVIEKYFYILQNTAGRQDAFMKSSAINMVISKIRINGHKYAANASPILTVRDNGSR